MQLHPGDLGWFWQFGAAATAAALRTWSRDGRVLAVGLLDSPTVLRLTMAPPAHRDEALTQQLVTDVTEPERGVLPAGRWPSRPRRCPAPGSATRGGLGRSRAVDAAAPRPHGAGEGPGPPGRGGRAGASGRLHGRAPLVVRQSPVHRRAVADDDDRAAVRRRAVPARLRRPRPRGCGGDGVVSLRLGSLDCWSRWESTPTIGGTATAGPSATPRRPPSRGWDRRARSSAPRPPTWPGVATDRSAGFQPLPQRRDRSRSPVDTVV